MKYLIKSYKGINDFIFGSSIENIQKNYNIKRAEEKARDLGFETIDNIRYINIK